VVFNGLILASFCFSSVSSSFSFFLAAGTTLLTEQLVTVYHPVRMFIGFVLIGIAMVPAGHRDDSRFSARFLCWASQTSTPPGRRTRPTSAGQNVELIRWLPPSFRRMICRSFT
jgi:hypothetical protein